MATVWDITNLASLLPFYVKLVFNFFKDTMYYILLNLCCYLGINSPLQPKFFITYGIMDRIYI